MTRHSRLRSLFILTTTALAFPSWAHAQAPHPLWTEESQEPGLDPDQPVLMSAFSELARRLSPAVVNIDVTHPEHRPTLPFFAPPHTQGLGTGFIIHEDGYILTNHHVVATAETIRVRLANEQEFEAQVVGAYPPLDISLLKIEAPEPLTVAPLGNSNHVAIGEWVIAIGNPFGLSHTVTAGIISAKGRRDVAHGREFNHARFLQTDASINPGNSGGPLINTQGKVIGVNTAISTAGQGIGFAVPIDMIKTILPKLAQGKVERSYLGVTVGPPPVERAKPKTISVPQGAYITKVTPKSPAAQVGLKEGQLITAINGEPLLHWEDLPWVTSTAGIGTELELTLQGEKGSRTVKVTLEAFPEISLEKDKLGLVVEPLDAKRASQAGLKSGQGLLIKEVEPRKLGSQLGLRRGDILTHINRKPVTRETDLNALEEMKGRLSLTLRRGSLQVQQTFER